MRILFSGCRIFDGTGSPCYDGDLLVDGDRIAAVGAVSDGADADVTVDARGLAVAPGFIDAHSHNDFFYDYDDAEMYYAPFIKQGIDDRADPHDPIAVCNPLLQKAFSDGSFREYYLLQTG